MSFLWLQDAQENDATLIDLCENNTEFHKKSFDEHELICYTPEGKDQETDWKICLTDSNVDVAIDWFHKFFNHPGSKRLLDGMHRYYHPKLRSKINNIKCDACQRYKVSGRGFGHLPPRDVIAAPWEQVDVDLIGPWAV